MHTSNGSFTIKTLITLGIIIRTFQLLFLFLLRCDPGSYYYNQSIEYMIKSRSNKKETATTYLPFKLVYLKSKTWQILPSIYIQIVPGMLFNATSIPPVNPNMFILRVNQQTKLNRCFQCKVNVLELEIFIELRSIIYNTSCGKKY